MNNGSNPILTLTVIATAALAANRFVTAAGAYPEITFGSTRAVIGVTRTSAAIGDLVAVDAIGTALVETSGAFALGEAVEFGEYGTVVANANSIACGRALQASTGSGQLVEVLLITPYNA